MTFAERIAEQAAAHHAENISRLRKQAANRASANGFDAACAADAAEHAYGAGDESHESILLSVAGPFRRVA